MARLPSVEATLIQAARGRLPAAAERRLRRLIAKSERGDLTPKELADYQALAQDAQRIDAARAEALAELARRRGQSVKAGGRGGSPRAAAPRTRGARTSPTRDAPEDQR
ncbi:MAG TPA: hypothetical protein VKA46_01055 [Gemmataceae bacterium]|nr:hypothetical protein [Gemmataceae bacterium]